MFHDFSMQARWCWPARTTRCTCTGSAPSATMLPRWMRSGWCSTLPPAARSPRCAAVVAAAAAAATLGAFRISCGCPAGLCVDDKLHRHASPAHSLKKNLLFKCDDFILSYGVPVKERKERKEGFIRNVCTKKKLSGFSWCFLPLRAADSFPRSSAPHTPCVPVCLDDATDRCESLRRKFTLTPTQRRKKSAKKDFFSIFFEEKFCFFRLFLNKNFVFFVFF